MYTRISGAMWALPDNQSNRNRAHFTWWTTLHHEEPPLCKLYARFTPRDVSLIQTYPFSWKDWQCYRFFCLKWSYINKFDFSPWHLSSASLSSPSLPSPRSLSLSFSPPPPLSLSLPWTLPSQFPPSVFCSPPSLCLSVLFFSWFSLSFSVSLSVFHSLSITERQMRFVSFRIISTEVPNFYDSYATKMVFLSYFAALGMDRKHLEIIEKDLHGRKRGKG